MSSTVENLASPPACAHPDTGGPSAGLALWMRRILMVVFVLVCLEIGMMLLIVPWTRVWTENPLLRNLPLRAFALNDFVRGAVSGLGLINLWMAVWEGVHYRDAKK